MVAARRGCARSPRGGPAEDLMQPTFRLLLAHPSHFIALGFGSGLAPKGSGTAGTLAAWLLYPLLRGMFSDWQLLGFLVASFFFGIVACERTGRALGVADHGAIVWDEIVAFWLFRFFDIVKPPPIRWVDERTRGGLGVMVDDLLAAGYALLVLALLVKLPGV